MSVREIYIHEVKNYYDNFYSIYVHDNRIKIEYHGAKFLFWIYFSDPKDVDEQLLFEFYMIVQQYSNHNKFQLRCVINKSHSDGLSDAYRVSTYAYIQNTIDRVGGTIYFSDGSHYSMLSKLNGISRLVPVFRVTKENLEQLKKPINQHNWNNIKNYNKSMDRI